MHFARFFTIGTTIIGTVAFAACTTEAPPTNTDDDQELPLQSDTPSIENENDVIARVNGEPVLTSVYQAALDQMQQMVELQGMDPNSDEIQQQAVDHVVTTVLLRQEAEHTGTVVSDEQVQQRYDQIVDQVGGQEAMEEQLAGGTEDALRAQIYEQILVQEFVNNELQAADITVTEEEVRAFYAEVEEEYGEDAPDFPEIESALQTQLQEQKQQMAISAVVSALREKADIEILL